jgi:DNA primase
MLMIWETPVLSTVPDIIDAVHAELAAQGVHLLKKRKISAGNYMVTCPFHEGSNKIMGDEKHPSMGFLLKDMERKTGIKPAGTCNCFRCGYVSDICEFVSKIFGKEDAGMFGYKWITERFVNLSIEKREDIVLDLARGKEVVANANYIPESVLEQYRTYHPYMYERKLTDKVIDYFDVGYDKKHHALTFPVHDLTGKVPLIQRRSIGRKQFINDEGADRGEFLYGLYQVYVNKLWIKEVIICESPIDALTCWKYRKPAVALMGSDVTPTQVELLRNMPARTLILGLDNPLIDKAGAKGIKKLTEQLREYKLLYQLRYPPGVKDINELTDEEFVEMRTTLL